MIIGLSGYAQTGKDTVAKYLIEEHGYRRVAFADKIREALYRLDPILTDIPEIPRAGLASAVDHIGWETLKQHSEQARGLLQRFGTEVGREMFGDNFWVDQAIKGVSKFDKVVFTDIRYPNEYKAVKLIEGKIIRIVKPSITAINGHTSESALDDYVFDGTIDNVGSIEELHKKIDLFVKG
jgi:hypothetical protein